MTRSQKIEFYATPPHACTYLPGREATTLFADPYFPKNTRIYSALANCGFRRSGKHLYMPHCNDCHACVPVRVPTDRFRPSRNQKRTWKCNADMIINELPATFNEEHFLLYQKYLLSRHRGGGMDNPTPDNYMEFLTAAWAETRFYEMRLDSTLVAVTVVDILDDALSAVYTFFDPAFARRSPGRFAILYQIEKARLSGLQWVYLGYWIKNCKKMAYKSEYMPIEVYRDNRWQMLEGLRRERYFA